MSVTSKVVRDPRQLFAEPKVVITPRSDGALLLRSPQALASYPQSISERLVHWNNAAPGRPFLMERASTGDWRCTTYAEALARVLRIAAGLLEHDLSPDRPLAILSDNSTDHALLMLAAMHVGVPSVSISAAYSLASADHAKLKRIIQLVTPGLVFVDDTTRYARAMEAVRQVNDATIVTGIQATAHGTITVTELESGGDLSAVARAHASVGPGTIAKLLFTSGSTDEPKGVINTQRMLCSNQQARAQVWPFLRETPPVLVDWLPWSHTFGGNFNFNLVLTHGGTLYIDAGRPAPGLFEHTVRNLREIQPTIYCNVPRGYDMLISALRSDAEMRENFFARLQVIFYAAAALPQNLWDALQELSVETIGERVPLVSAWGATETAPLATDCHFQAERSGVIGIPVPGSELKLVPNGEKLEVRVRGPNVTPGYWKRPDLTASHFDEEGFYRIGDAVRFVDRAAPERGLLFDGRVSEDFKLDSGTWVNVGMLRVRAITALAPIAQDIVLTGHDRSDIGFLIFPNLAACRGLCSDLPRDAAPDLVLSHPKIRAAVVQGLELLRTESKGSSTFAARALLLAEPPTIDAGENTDKGYINQRVVLTRRARLVEALYTPAEHADVITI